MQVPGGLLTLDVVEVWRQGFERQESGRTYGLAVTRHEAEPPDLVFPTSGFEITFEKRVKEGTLGSQSPQQPDEKAAQTRLIKLPKRADVRLQAGQSAFDGTLQRMRVDRDRGPTGALEGSPDLP